jgi:uncharacterized protein
VTLMRQDKFRRLKALRRSSFEPLGLSAIDSSPNELVRLEQILGATTKRNQYGEYLSLRCWSAQAARYAPSIDTLRLLIPNAMEQIADPEQWLFLDTETTGLAGGSGTYAFLVGIGWWEGAGLEIEQFFMRDYSEEHALLLALADRLAERRVVVTFNGKTFDWPLLETRYRMSRKIPVPAPQAHLDFLHPARSLWGLRVGSARLSELERHVLGWDRGKDLQSELIPRIYQDFVRGGSPERLVPIFYHNQMDLRGLAAISSRILSLLSHAETEGKDGLEIFGVSRICERRGENTRARKLYEKSIAAILPTDHDRAARHSLAKLAKREGDFHVACELWKSALENSRQGYQAYEQLAIYYEHHVHDLEKAQDVVRQALDELHRAIQIGAITPGAYHDLRGRFDRRMARLKRKISRPLFDAMRMHCQA